MTEPLISIILPLYNAEQFLRDGLTAVKQQSYINWELIVVNDGSTDSTANIFNELTNNWQQNIKFLEQENAGPYAARNLALDQVKGDYIAFLDIDDLWYGFHLAEHLQLLEDNPEIDWVYAANKMIDLTDNRKVITESNFYQSGKAKDFLKLKNKTIANAKLITDKKAVICQLESGLQLGYQFSLSRRKVFKDYRFSVSFRSQATDQVGVIHALKSGFNIAYTTKVHGDYMVHSSNSSAASKTISQEKALQIRTTMVNGFKELKEQCDFSKAELAAIDKRIANEYFWNIGYNIYLKNNQLNLARQFFLKGLKLTPFNVSMWKSYLVSFLGKLP